MGSFGIFDELGHTLERVAAAVANFKVEVVACGFASNVFNSVPTVFSCLNSLGIDYSHETLEDVSVKINQMRTLYAHL